jgi:NADH-quinone oxidoreductase subunit L
MVIPLIILGFLSLVGGWIGVPKAMGGSERFAHFLEPVFTAYAPATTAAEAAPPAETNAAHEESTGMELGFAGISVAVALFGFFLAWYLYHQRPELPERMAKAAGGLYRLVLDKYRIDELYGAVIIQPLIALSANVFWKGIDHGIIDATVDGGAAGARQVSDELRHMQSGNIRSYAGWVAVGATAVIVFMVWRGLR